MFSKFNKALNDRRAGIKSDEGFTLIELLVVVIIIGILAAIAIPIYIGVQNNAKDSAVKTDVANLKTAIVSVETNTNAIPDATSFASQTDLAASPTNSTQSWAQAGATLGDDTTTLSFTKSGDTFCITGVSDVGGDPKDTFYATDTKGVSTTPCS